jgi:hypothetical protein
MPAFEISNKTQNKRISLKKMSDLNVNQLSEVVLNIVYILNQTC